MQGQVDPAVGLCLEDDRRRTHAVRCGVERQMSCSTNGRSKLPRRGHIPAFDLLLDSFMQVTLLSLNSD
jgi:hypothetical protein